MELKAALDMYESAQLGYEPGTQPAEEIIARSVVENILPSLRAMLSMLGETSSAWTTGRNKIQEKILQAAAAGEPLAGYDPKDWTVWGQLLSVFNTILETEQTVNYPDRTYELMTLREAINTVYNKVVVS